MRHSRQHIAPLCLFFLATFIQTPAQGRGDDTSDRRAILSLFNTLANFYSHGDVAGVENCFTSDAVLRGKDDASSTVAQTSVSLRKLFQVWKRSSCTISVADIVISGSTATVNTSTRLAYSILDKSQTQLSIAQDMLIKTPEGWKIKEAFISNTSVNIVDDRPAISSRPITILPIQMLPLVVEEGQDYIIRVRISTDTGWKPDVFFFVRPLANSTGNSPDESRFHPEVQGTDYKSGVNVLFRYHAVIPGGNNERYEGLYKLKVLGFNGDKRVVDQSLPDDENKYYKIVIKGRPLKMMPLTPRALVGHWANKTYNFEFFEDGTMVVLKCEELILASSSGQYRLVGSNRLKIDARGFAFLFKNVFIRDGELHLIPENNRPISQALRKQ